MELSYYSKLIEIRENFSSHKWKFLKTDYLNESLDHLKRCIKDSLGEERKSAIDMLDDINDFVKNKKEYRSFVDYMKKKKIKSNEVKAEDIEVSNIRIDIDLKEKNILYHVEKQAILQTVGFCKDNKTAAARYLGISSRGLRNKLDQYNYKARSTKCFKA